MAVAVVAMLAAVTAAATGPAPVAAVPPSTPLVTTLAGNGAATDTSGAAPVAAGMAFGPTWAIADVHGRAIVSDRTTCRLRWIDLAGLVTDIAGTGTCGYADPVDHAGPQAALAQPTGLALAGDLVTGVVYVADTGNCLVRRLEVATGLLTTYAGLPPDTSGVRCGGTGDGGLATSARLDGPTGLDVDAAGNLYIAETTGCRIRKVASDGTISTIAGSGTCGYQAGAATSARFNGPRGVAVTPGGAVVVADTLNHRVRYVSGGSVTTVAGTGTAGGTGDGGVPTAALLSSPQGVDVDAAGRVFVADSGSCRIRRFTVNGTITTSAGTGTCGDSGERGAATSAQLGAVGNVSVAPSGDLVISDVVTSTRGKVKVVDGAAAPTAHTSVHSALVHDWRAYGNSNVGGNWTAGDGAYSIELPDGRVLWYYSDSYVGSSNPASLDYIEPDHSRGHVFFINNQVVVQTPNPSGPSTFENQWPYGVRQNYFANPAAGRVYWPGASFMKDEDTVSVLLRDWRLPVPGVPGDHGEIVGVAVADIDVDDLDAPPTPVDIPALAPSGSNPNCTEVEYQDSALADPDGLGYTYVYGIERCPGGVLGSVYHLHVARLQGTDLTAASSANPWRYWVGGTWSANPADGYAVAGRLPTGAGGTVDDALYEASIVRTDGGYRMTAMYGRSVGGVPVVDLRRRTAPNPWGPWSAPESLIDIPDVGRAGYNSPATCTLVPYNAKEQAPFASDTDMVISYHVKVVSTGTGCPNGPPPPAWDTGDLNKNVDLYRPRYVRARIEAPNAPTGVTPVHGSHNSVTLAWQLPTDDGGAWPSAYRITAHVGGSPVHTVTVPTANTILNGSTVTGAITGLTNGTSYTFKVEAINEAGTGPASAASTTASPSRCGPYASCTAAVDDVYRALMNKVPTTTERTNAVNALTAGTTTLGAIAEGFRSNAEHLNNIDPVIRMYLAFFLRLPDLGGYRYWVKQRREPTTLADIADDFASSPEFTTLYGTLSAEEYVELVYNNVLERDGDPSGIAYWTGQIENQGKTRGWVMTQFSETSENKTQDAPLVRDAAAWLNLHTRPPTLPERDPAASFSTLTERLLRRSDYSTAHVVDPT
ncbi:MAG TPA: DUF4214 domain-containing protein [Iamia sp.]